MSKDWNYKPGDWNVICDVCGKKMKASHAKHRWDGLIVCDEDFEHRHSQDFLKVKSDKITVPFTRPIPEESFRYTTPWDEDSPPFLAEVSVVDSLLTTASYIRVFSDSVTPSDVTRFNGNVLLGDTATVADSFSILNNAIPVFGDNTGTSTSGYLWHNSYIDGTYFEDVYVATSTTLIS